MDAILREDDGLFEVMGCGFELSLPKLTNDFFGYNRAPSGSENEVQASDVLCLHRFVKPARYIWLSLSLAAFCLAEEVVFCGFESGGLGWAILDHNAPDHITEPSSHMEKANASLAERGKKTRFSTLTKLFNPDNSASAVRALHVQDECLYSLNAAGYLTVHRIERSQVDRISLRRLFQVCCFDRLSDPKAQFEFVTPLCQAEPLYAFGVEGGSNISDLIRSSHGNASDRRDHVSAVISALLVSQHGVVFAGCQDGSVRALLQSGPATPNIFPSFSNKPIVAIIPAFYANKGKNSEEWNIQEGLNFLAVLTSDARLFTFELDANGIFQQTRDIDLAEQIPQAANKPNDFSRPEVFAHRLAQ